MIITFNRPKVGTYIAVTSYCILPRIIKTNDMILFVWLHKITLERKYVWHFNLFKKHILGWMSDYRILINKQNKND